MKRAIIAEKNVPISVVGERVVVGGGTQGIGAGIACRFAQGGAEVWIIGRNETKAQAVLAKLKEISQEKKIVPVPEHRFFKADLSLVAETVRTAEDIRTHAGPRGVDYLVMCQGGPNNGRWVLTSERIDQHYGVQVLSRFVLAYKLITEPDPIVTKSVMSVMGPGFRLSQVDYEDLDLSVANRKGTYGMLTCLTRDSVVIDTFTEELARRKPDVAFTHVFPGYVATDLARNTKQAWYKLAIATVYLAIAGDTPASYAEVAFYLLAHPDGRTATSHTPFWDKNAEKLPGKPLPALQDQEIRSKIWDHLVGMIKTHSSG